MMRMFMNPAPPLLSVLLALARVEGTAAQDAVPPHETFIIESTVLGETRRINVYTPPGYQPAGRASYPVLYVLDGGVQEGFPHVAASVDTGIRAREIRPMLVVGIENTERHRDMTPAEAEAEGRRLPRRVGDPTLGEADRRIAPRVDGPAAFRSFIAGELMPEMRRRYRLTRESAIMGESLAGLFVVETLMRQEDLFGTYIALSPTLWWNREALVRMADARFQARRLAPGSPSTVVFLSSSDEENIGPAVERLAQVLSAKGANVRSRRYPPQADLAHATFYRAVAPQVLRHLFPPVFSISAIITRPERIVRDLGEEVTPLSDGTRVRREPVGPFTIMREEYTLPDSVPRDLHSPTRWTKVHLSFDTPDRRVNVTLTDNGSGLWATAQSPGCWATASYLQYALDEDEEHLFDAMFAALRTLMEPCAAGMEDPAGYLRLLERAEINFPAAVRLMKARAFDAFGARTARCTPPEPMHIPSPHGDDPCDPS